MSSTDRPPGGLPGSVTAPLKVMSGKRARGYWALFGIRVGVQVLERASLALVALKVTQQGFFPSFRGPALALALALSAALRSGLRYQMVFAVRKALYRASSSRLLGPYALGRSQLTPRQLFDGLGLGELLLCDAWPDLISDSVGLLLVGALLLRFGDVGQGLGVALAAGAVGAVGVLFAQFYQRAAEQRAWKAYIPTALDMRTALCGGAEIIANGAREKWLQRAFGRMQHWHQQSRRAELLGRATARLPLVAACLALVALATTRPEAGASPLKWLAPAGGLAALVPPLLSWATALVRVVKHRSATAPFWALWTTSETASPPVHLEQVGERLVLQDVRFAYGPAAPQLALSRSFERGKVWALVGANGTGKSTLLKLLAGAMAPSAGSITWEGSAAKPSAFAHPVAYLAQAPYFDAQQSVLDAAEGLGVGIAPLEAWLERLHAKRDLLAGSPRGCMQCSALSAGELQRLALARVLAREGHLLLLDEPESALDSSGLTALAALLPQLAKNRIVVIATHHAQLLAGCDEKVEVSTLVVQRKLR